MDSGAWWARVHGGRAESDRTVATEQAHMHVVCQSLLLEAGGAAKAMML